MLDFKGIAAQALAHIDTLIREWLPDGKRSGAEWQALNPTRSDGAIGSFSVNLNTGAWGDFATDDAGGDLVSLYAYLNRVDQGEAARVLAAQLGIAVPANQPARSAQPAPPPKAAPAAASVGAKRVSPWIALPEVPIDAPWPPVAHSVRGKPSMRWQYRRGETVLGWVYRFETSDGGKEVLPIVWARNSITNKEEWRWLSMGKPRPLYLPGSDLRDGFTVLIVEGEKCAVAAHEDLMIRAQYDVVSWPGGGKAVGKVDWSWLAGRKVVIWPDCDAQRDKETKQLLPAKDQPGIKAAEWIARELADQNCAVRIMTIPAPGEQPPGWDVADAIINGITGEALLTLIRRQHAPAHAGPDTAPAQPAMHQDDLRNAGWRDQLIWGKDSPRDCRENVIYVLRDHPEWVGTLAIDTFASRITCMRETPLGHKVGDEWRPDDESALALWMSEQAQFTVRSLDTISQSVRHVALLKQMHPVQDYFGSLEWDQRSRIGRWVVDFMDCEDTPYSRMVGLFFMINVVRRIYEPGCVMRSLPVFEGAQNKGKSRALWTLAHPWYADTMLRIGDKDAYQLLQGMMIYEISEMDSFSRAEASAVKAFISSTEDRFRAPYERSPTTHRRQTSFAATTNAAEYLKDWTGNTRFWPLAIGEFIDLDGLALARDQLWAEAVALYRQGVRAYPTSEQERELFKPQQDKRMIVHPWQEMVADYVQSMTHRHVTTREIMQDALKIDLSRVNPQGSEAQRVGQILNGLGYTKAQSTVNGRRDWVWKPPVAVHGDGNGVAF